MLRGTQGAECSRDGLHTQRGALAGGWPAQLPHSRCPSPAQVLSNIPVGLLVNSAGVSYEHAEYFDAVSQADISAIINVNVVATTRVGLTKLPPPPPPPGTPATRRQHLCQQGPSEIAPAGIYVHL